MFNSTAEKTLCPKHRFFYKGRTCPFCENERILKITAKFSQEPVKEKPAEPEKSEPGQEQVTAEMLDQLKAKFNSR